MTLEPRQLEWIVQEVLRRLSETSTESAKGATGGDLYLTERLVTTHTLNGRLASVRQVTIERKAIITPAAKDLLKERAVKLIRRQ